MLGLPGGHTLEVPDPERSLPAALAIAGKRPSWVVRMQRAWAAAIVALALLLGAGIWTYMEGLPIAARYVASALPSGFDRRIGENLLALLDANTLEASSLPPERRARIVERFQRAAAVAAPGVEVRVEFRAGEVNAFALPGGIIVLFDELVELAGDDERVLGVLGHELGHVVHRTGRGSCSRRSAWPRSRSRVGRLLVGRRERSAGARHHALWPWFEIERTTSRSRSSARIACRRAVVRVLRSHAGAGGQAPHRRHPRFPVDPSGQRSRIERCGAQSRPTRPGR